MTLIQGDCLQEMDKLIEQGIKVDLTVTSPPYDNLRTYNNSLVWNEIIWKQVIEKLYKITKIGGVVVWVVGDATIKGSETGTSFKQALYFKEVGFNLHDTMIWDKKSQAVHDYRNKRYKQETEYMFILSKGKPNTYNEIKDRHVKHAGKIINKSTKRKADGSIRKFPQIILGNYQARSNVWHCEPERNSNHPAPFPEKLVHDHIISWSNENDIILDPFMGSGTTGKMAKQLNRNFIGIELGDKYFNTAKERIEETIYQPDLFTGEELR